MAAQASAPGLRRVDASFISTERRLAAQLNARHFRSLRLTSLQVLAIASPPLWARAHGVAVWGWVTWLAFLVVGTCLALAISYAVLEHRWHRRAQRQAHPRALAHIAGAGWGQARAGLWSALAAASVPPWAASGLGRPLPAWLLDPCVLAATALMSSLVVIEMIRGASRLNAGSYRPVVDVHVEAEHNARPGPQVAHRLDDAS